MVSFKTIQSFIQFMELTKLKLFYAISKNSTGYPVQSHAAPPYNTHTQYSPNPPQQNAPPPYTHSGPPPAYSGELKFEFEFLK